MTIKETILPLCEAYTEEIDDMRIEDQSGTMRGFLESRERAEVARAALVAELDAADDAWKQDEEALALCMNNVSALRAENAKLRDYGRAEYLRAIEDAAKVCESIDPYNIDKGRDTDFIDCAKAIRTLAGEKT